MASKIESTSQEVSDFPNFNMHKNGISLKLSADRWAASDLKAWLETSEFFGGLAAEYWPTVQT